MENIVIPNIAQNQRIGSIFNTIFDIILRSETLNENVVWDFTRVSFLHPFLLSALSIFKHNTNYDIKCKIPQGTDLERFLKLINFELPIKVDGECDTISISQYLKTDISPIFCFKDLNGSETAQVLLERIVKSHHVISPNFKTAITYILSELICNINEHSEYGKGYLFAQYLPHDRTLNICVADDGISIYGSYMKTSKYLDDIDSEAAALELATNGFSTKNLPFAENRGYGISTSSRMVVEGMGGSIYMLSGQAFHHHDIKVSEFINLPKSLNWDGTLILLRIPVDIPESFNYIEYISR